MTGSALVLNHVAGRRGDELCPIFASGDARLRLDDGGGGRWVAPRWRLGVRNIGDCWERDDDGRQFDDAPVRFRN